MNGHKPPEWQFPESAANVAKRQVDDYCDHTGKNNSPAKRENVTENQDIARVYIHVVICGDHKTFIENLPVFFR